MEKLNYNQDIEIDPNALDVEWTRQAQTFMKYSVLAAEARDKADRLKEALEVMDAGLGLKIRTSPEKFGLEKVTEAGVQATILIDTKHAEASIAWADAKYELEVLTAAVRALDQKKAALENLVRLQGQNYFAGPSVPRDVGKEWAADVERRSARDSVKRSLNRGSK